MVRFYMLECTLIYPPASAPPDSPLVHNHNRPNSLFPENVPPITEGNQPRNTHRGKPLFPRTSENSSYTGVRGKHIERVQTPFTASECGCITACMLEMY